MSRGYLKIEVNVTCNPWNDTMCGVVGWDETTNNKQEAIDAILKRVKKILEERLDDGDRMTIHYGKEWTPQC